MEVFYILAGDTLPITKELFPFQLKGNYLQHQLPKDILLYKLFYPAIF